MTSGSGHGSRRTPPWVFTEHGIAMFSSVLNSPLAIQVNIEIMRTFVRLRRLMASPGDLVEQLHRIAETVKTHDGEIKQMERPAPKRIKIFPKATHQHSGQ